MREASRAAKQRARRDGDMFAALVGKEVELSLHEHQPVYGTVADVSRDAMRLTLSSPPFGEVTVPKYAILWVRDLEPS